MFIIAQRISSVNNADKIIVLDDGKIVGIGTHRALLAGNAVYQEINQSQQEGVLRMNETRNKPARKAEPGPHRGPGACRPLRSPKMQRGSPFACWATWQTESYCCWS